MGWSADPNNEPIYASNNIVVLCSGLLITREYNKVFMNCGYLPDMLEFWTLLNGTLVQSPTMLPYTRWVHDSFKHILVDSCDGYLQTNDRSIDKGRSKFIAQVAADIADSARKGNVTLPNDLEKVWKCFLCIVAWYEPLSIVCPNMAWKLCVCIFKGQQAGQSETWYSRLSNIHEVMDHKNHVQTSLFWPCVQRT